MFHSSLVYYYYSIPLVLLANISTLKALDLFDKESHFPGDTFPTCIDIIDIEPLPFSYLPNEGDGNMTFIVTFSRAVTQAYPYERRNGDWRQVPEAFLTPSIAEFQEILPQSVGFVGSSRSKRYYIFNITSDERRIYKKLYLVIDGEKYYTADSAFGGAWIPYVPASIFGEYYVHSIAVRKRQPLPIINSPYCNVRLKRPLPEPFYDNPVKAKFSLEIVDEGHILVEKTKQNYELRVSVLISGVGSGSIQLPSTLKAHFQGVNVTVAVPVGMTLKFQRSDLWYQIPVGTQIIHEIVERIYHTRAAKPMIRPGGRFLQPGLGPPDLIRGRITDKGTIELITHDTLSFVYSSFPFGGSSNTYGYFSMEGGLKAPVDPRFVFGKSYRYHSNHVPRYIYSHRCDPDSNRTRESGRRGPINHIIQLGPFYRLLIPDVKNAKDWIIKSKTKVIVQFNDVTRKVSFGGPNSNKRIPKFLYDAVSRYVILVRPVSEVEHKEVIIALDEGIFVPRDNLHNKCNGILQYKNIVQKRDHTFCNKKFGDCIGLPFTSTLRFPVISPFGVSEFAGWTHDRNKMPSSLIGKASHPMSQHFSNQVTVPRALYHAQGHKKFIYLSAPDGSTDHISDIPIIKAKLLKPDFELTAPSVCDKIWKLEETFEREATLSVQLHNNGQGGADVTLTVKCTIHLILLHPSNGQTTVWIGPKTESLVRFKLDALRAISEKSMPHKCELNITVHVPVGHPSQSLRCSQIITTYAGLFHDPCQVEASALPLMDLKYFLIPIGQQHKSSSGAIKTLLAAPNGKDLVFMRAISVILTVPYQHEHLVTNLQELKIQCRHGDIYLIEEEELIHKATLIATGIQDRQELSWTNTPISIFSSLLKKRQVYYFAKKNWVNLHSSDTPTKKTDSFSGCTIEIWANRPHKICDNPTKLKTLFVPLVEADIPAIELEERSQFWYLESVYGNQSDNIILTLISCVGVTILCFLITGSGHVILFTFRKKLPNEKKLSKLEKQLKQGKVQEKKRWENPQMFLQTGKHGPYYTLYNFKCTGKMKNSELKSLKVAGLLKYQDKELQVMFGHVKKIYLASKDKSGNIWLQASSGMYLLEPHNVHGEYQDELKAFYKEHGVKVKIPLDKTQPDTDKNKTEKVMNEQ